MRSVWRGLMVPVVLGAVLDCSGARPPGARVTEPLPHRVDAVPGPSPRASESAPPALGLAAEGYAARRRHARTDDVCETADDNVDRDVEAVLAGAGGRTPAPAAPWDHKSTPEYLDRVDARFALSPKERALLFEQGFVVPNRLSHATYARAFHDVFQSELPVYISMDSLLYAVFRANDALIASVESARIWPTLPKVLDDMAAELVRSERDYPKDSVRDVDVYLTVARSLLAGEPVKSGFGTDVVVQSLVRDATDAGAFSEVELFGRRRMIDFTQYLPRGHYESMAPEFKATMWLSRLEFNLVSRSSRSSAPGFTPDPRDTPREAIDALVIADLAAKTGATARLESIDHDWGALGGRREDVSVTDLVALWKKAGGGALTAPDAFDRLKGAIGNDFQRTARLHYMPQYSTVLPAITTLLGPRVFDDVSAIRLLAHSEVAGRYRVTASDLAYVFGHDRALEYLKRDLAEFPTLRPQLGAARDKIRTDTTSAYGQWFSAVRALAETPKGSLPSFTRTKAFADLRMNSAIAAYGQIRHNYVLLSGQAYDEGGCAIPDGYVEPAPAVLDALIRYVDAGAQMAGAANAAESTWTELGRMFRTLRVIVGDELKGSPLSEEQRRFLAEVAEIVPPSSDSAPEYNGWYFHLFESTEVALEDAGFVGEYFTSSNTGEVAYLGTSGPRLGLFVVDTGGPPRVMVGPVARAFEYRAPMTKRLRDTDLAALGATSAPWQASYTVSQPAEPPVVIDMDWSNENPQLVVKSPRNLGRVVVESLDHHRRPCASTTVFVSGGAGRGKFKDADGSGDCSAEGIRIRIGTAVYESVETVSFPTSFGGANPYPAVP